MSGKSRGVFEMIVKHFVNSLKPKKSTTILKGKDHLGNKYYEVEEVSANVRKRPSRYFEPAVVDEFEQNMPAEWEAWLRFRRNRPPTDEEIRQSQAMIHMKKTNAAKLEAELTMSRLDKDKLLDAAPKQTGATSFPTYDEYEQVPGQPKNPKNS